MNGLNTLERNITLTKARKNKTSSMKEEKDKRNGVDIYKPYAVINK
jgi:hypothetical protein